MLRTLRRIAVLSLCTLSGAAYGQQDIFWANPQGGVWSGAENWSPATVPNNDGNTLYNATLDALGSPYTVTLDIDVTLQNFSLLWSGVTLDLLDRGLTINESAIISNGLVTRTATTFTKDVLVVGGLTLEDSTLMGAGVFRATGGVNIMSASNVDICNTCVDTSGPSQVSGSGSVSLNMGGEINNQQGGTLTLSATSSRTIQGDGTGRFNNAGTLNNGANSSRGLPGVTTFSGVNFSNTGTLNVFTGGIALFTSNDLTNNGTLEDGTWNVFNGSFLDFGDSQVFRLAAEINISGSDAQVFGISQLDTVEQGGRFGVLAGQNFSAFSTFTNFGEVEVGFGSVFDSGQGLTNVDGDGLFGGRYIVAGVFNTGAEVIRLLQADLTLIGADSVFSGIGGLDEVGSSGRFAIEGGRNFSTLGNLGVQDGGFVKVGAGSVLEVTGLLLNNDTSGLFDAAAFEVQGTFIASNLNIIEISNELILDGIGSQLLDAAGNDAIANLQRIRGDGILRLRNGRNLDVSNLIIDGVLSIEGAPGAPGSRGETPGTVRVAGTTRFTERSTLEILINGAEEAEYGKLLSDQLEVVVGSTLSLLVGEGAGLKFGDELMIVQAGNMVGEFTGLLGLDIGNGLSFEVFQNQSGVVLRVVPAPASAMLVCGAGLLAARRRRHC
ncbi:MAG: hypothetical protein D6692_13435 [Planctomycetota bacterium]|nr:MAG: hypothetical protein D6692_13435 [Planctomycetota bacterium]